MPEIAEPIERINQQLVDSFGADTLSNQPIWRVVWSEDQYEKRLTNFTESGVELIHPQVLLLPKYKQWVKEKYVLERLVVVPDVNINELVGAKVSYEPVWAFVDGNNQYLPPRFDACQFIIQLIYAAQGKEAATVYKDPEAGLDARALYEQKKARLDELQNELYGDESSLKGKTHLTGEGVVISNTDYLEKKQ